MGHLRDVSFALLILTYIKLASLSYRYWETQLETTRIGIDPSLEPNKAVTELNYTLCSNLHNEIVELGWRGYHPNSNASTRAIRTYWDYYGEAAENISSRLSPSLISFLKLAQMPEDGLSFTYELSGLGYPSLFNMWYGLQDMDDEDTAVVLYASNEGGHSMGLVFNHELNLAIYAPSIFDHQPPHEMQLMYPLETALRLYLDMIKVGKIASLPEPECENQANYKKPWAFRPYTRLDLELATNEFRRLVNAIADRIPVEDMNNETLSYITDPYSRQPIIAASELNFQIKTSGFLQCFLATTEKPPFKYIAPGLTFPTPSTLSSLMNVLPLPDWAEKAGFTQVDLPILLFPSSPELHVTAPENKTLDGSDMMIKSLNDIPSGLYLGSQNSFHSSFSNGIIFVTPFPLGANSHALKADWSHVGDEWHVERNHTDLYQMGRNSFIGRHTMQLHHVLRSWAVLVEEGIWEVDAEGVKGGMESWKMADDEEMWWRFKIDAAMW